jgi:hypothetical protein
MSVSTFDEYLARYRPEEFDKQRLDAMTPEQRTREDLQRAMRELASRRCTAHLRDTDAACDAPAPNHQLTITEVGADGAEHIIERPICDEHFAILATQMPVGRPVSPFGVGLAPAT